MVGLRDSRVHGENATGFRSAWEPGCGNPSQSALDLKTEVYALPN